MRPVNLIPPEERPGERRPMRGGPLAYIIVGALAAAVIGVTVLAVTGNQISDSKAEIAKLENEGSAVEARAQALAAFTQFHTLREQRDATITSLADSRFDWQRVMRELSLILPSNVWLTNLTGTASPGSSVDGGGSGSLRGGIAGPALEMTGCASGQDAVAGFIQALKEIDGVTRVGVQSSALGSGGSSSSTGSGSTCQTRSFIAQFQLVVAFDAAPVASEDGESSAAAPSTTTTASTETETGGQLQMRSSNRLIVSILLVAALAVAFWILALGPKREEASELAGQVDQLQVSLAEARSKVLEATAARHEFPADYRQLVVLGQAVPAGDETSSLLAGLNHIAASSGVKFDSIQLEGLGEAASAPAPVSTPTTPATPSGGSGSSAVPASSTVPPTEAAASLMPLGASIGPAGLAVMPYSLTFSGDFFHIADFIGGIDSLVHTSNSGTSVDGRLITLDGFALNAGTEPGFPQLNATFSVTTYLTPPNQGVTAGATPAAPAPSTATPASDSTSESEEAPSSGSSSESSSETASAR